MMTFTSQSIDSIARAKQQSSQTHTRCRLDDDFAKQSIDSTARVRKQ